MGRGYHEASDDHDLEQINIENKNYPAPPTTTDVYAYTTTPDRGRRGDSRDPGRRARRGSRPKNRRRTRNDRRTQKITPRAQCTLLHAIRTDANYRFHGNVV